MNISVNNLMATGMLDSFNRQTGGQKSGLTAFSHFIPATVSGCTSGYTTFIVRRARQAQV